MSAKDGLESIAKMMVSQYARVTLYPTDTPVVRPDVLVTVMLPSGTFVVLTTNLPDGVLYTVTWASPKHQPILTAYKKLEDMQVH